MPDAVEAYNNSEGVLSIYGVLLVQAAAAQNIMVVASNDVFCLSVQRSMALIFVESAMSSHVKCSCTVEKHKTRHG